VEVTEVSLERPVLISGTTRVQVQVAGDEVRLWVLGGDGAFHVHATGLLRAATPPAGQRDPEALAAELAPFSVDDALAKFRAGGLFYGPAFQGHTAIWGGGGRALAALRLPEGVPNDLGVVNPALVDAAFHAGVALGGGEIGVPFSMEVFRLTATTDVRWAYVQVRGEGVDVELLDGRGTVVGEIRGLRTRVMRDTVDTAEPLYREDWVAVPAPAEDAAGEASLFWFDGDLTADVQRAVSFVQQTSGPILMVGRGPAAGAAARGFVKSWLQETAEAPVRAVELAPELDGDAILRRESAATDGEPCVRWTAMAEREAHRLGRDRQMVPPDAPSWRLLKSASGELEGLRLAPLRSVGPRPRARSSSRSPRRGSTSAT
jgi:polyketide synthase 7